MVPSFLLSLLRAQQMAMGDKFGERYPNHWLVWEPGTWTAPAAAHDTVQIDPRTPAAGTGLGKGDALSFALKPAPGKPEQLTVGRNHSNDIIINDATVSRQHAVLRPLTASTWTIELAPNVRALTRLGEMDLRHGERVQLKSGTTLRLGDVRLTYYDLAGLVKRLKA